MKNKSIFFLFGILFIVAMACNLPSGIATPSNGDVNFAETQTSLALTQAAVQNQNPAPVFTATINPTPTITPVSTSSIPMVSVSLETNCRTGPAKVYSKITSLLVGEKAEIVGKYSSFTPVYWIIKKGSGTCWLWGQYATVDGNTSNLPEMIPPPSPTPAPTFTPTATTTPPAAGDLHIIDVFLKTNFEVSVRVGTDPNGSLSGNYQYTVYSNGAQVQQGSCTVPTGSHLCATGHIVSGTETIQVVIDSNNMINETNEGNNSTTLSCVKATLACN